MENVSRAMFSALLILAVLGCQEHGRRPQDAPRTEMQGRLEAALAMDEGVARHNMLVQCARDAAEAGDGDVVLEARPSTCGAPRWPSR
jgi:hypothetical protein